MPDPQRLLRTLDQAIAAFRATPGRRGRIVDLTAATEVLIAGDLHGNVENLRRILEIAQLAKHPGRHLVLQEVIHSTFQYAAGGDKSHQLLDLVAALKCQYTKQIHLLPGNHELSQATNRVIAKNDVELNAAFREGVGTAYGPRAAEVYAGYLRMIAVLPVVIRTANRVILSHSLPSAKRLESFRVANLEKEESAETDLVPGGSIHALVWGRDTRQATVLAYLNKMDGDWLITGHIPCEKGHAEPNERQVILDAMASPACCCLFPANRPVSLAELVNCIKTL